MEFEIYFNDLTEETQTELLNKLNIKDSDDMNWDIFPLAIINIDD